MTKHSHPEVAIMQSFVRSLVLLSTTIVTSASSCPLRCFGSTFEGAHNLFNCKERPLSSGQESVCRFFHGGETLLAHPSTFQSICFAVVHQTALYNVAPPADHQIRTLLFGARGKQRGWVKSLILSSPTPRTDKVGGEEAKKGKKESPPDPIH